MNRAQRRANARAQYLAKLAAECLTKCEQRVGRATVAFEQANENFERTKRELGLAREALLLARNLPMEQEAT
jgi:hypothetical protein